MAGGARRRLVRRPLPTVRGRRQPALAVRRPVDPRTPRIVGRIEDADESLHVTAVAYRNLNSTYVLQPLTFSGVLGHDASITRRSSVATSRESTTKQTCPVREAPLASRLPPAATMS